MSKPSLKSSALAAQRAWAESQGLRPDPRGYLPEIALNLRVPMSPAIYSAFDAADGAELENTKRRPAKMRALISSSALAVNVFAHWENRDATPLLKALGLSGEVEALRFEERLPTGARGTPPNLDIAIRLRDASVVGIESKFTEWMTPSEDMAKSLKPYIRGDESYWSRAELPQSHALATALLQGSAVAYRYLNVPQLLKHALGLKKNASAGWRLIYLFMDGVGEAADDHRKEVARFEREVGHELHFTALSYGTLIERLAFDSVDAEYLSYMRSRYLTSR